MLKLRILTAAILLPLVVFGTLYSSNQGFATGVAIVVMLAAWEWIRLAGIKNLLVRVAYTSLFACVTYLFYTSAALHVYTNWIIYGAAVLWLLLVVFIMFDPVRHLASISAPLRTFLTAMLGLVLLLAMWLAFVSIHQLNMGPALILAMFVLVWAADTGAYFAGRKWGSRKLAPRVSPGKTWEGAAGGLILALLLAALTPYIIDLDLLELELPGVPAYLGIAVVTVTVSIYGDLLESVIKRVAGEKDSGRLLPGHGGILDRIDSVIAAAPVFLAGLLIW